MKLLWLLATQVTDLSPLAGLTNLKVLDLDSTQATDLSPLEGLTNLERLFLRNTQVTKEDVQKLQKALPNCTIKWDGE
ncbi:MAG: leucine-rich repeat domain-containing protein [Planctomycetes bacterium]|nr:leucine-rich repeat domain-containing protein [Planctomycetota bacterium]